MKFMPLVMLVDQILTEIKDKQYLKWPRPLPLSPSVREEILPFSQRSRALHRGLPRFEGADRRTYTEREITKVHENGRFQQVQGQEGPT